jgi:hypothetical protein
MQDIDNWIDRISIPDEKLGNFPICPFAKKDYKIHFLSTLDISPIKNILSNNLTIVIFPTDISFKMLDNFCKQCNSTFEKHIFLPDHPEKINTINGIETGNKKHALIMIQLRDELLAAREKLSKTAYYSFWTKEYLQEICSYGNMDRMG